MATSLVTSLPWALAGCTYDNDGGDDLRNSTVTPFFYDPGPSGVGSTISPLGGVIGGAGLLVTAAGGLTVAVEQGHFVAPNTTSPTSGAYASTLSQSGNLTLASADPSNPRIDIIVAGVTDNGDSSSSGWVKAVTGTPSSSPSVPAAPANSITLAQVAVAANATTVVNGNITDKRPFTCATGGILVAQKGTVAGYIGQIAYDNQAGYFYHNGNGGAFQAAFLPFGPVMKSTAANWTMSTTPTTIPGLSATVTCDGITDLKVTYSVAGFTGITSATTYVTVAVYIDGVVLDQKTVRLDNTLTAQGGLTGIGYTDSTLGNTPSAGSHTITCQAWSNTGAPSIHEFSGLPAAAYMRIEPTNQ